MAVRVGGTLYFLHGDHLGSATVTTDASGNRVGELRYTPYGVLRHEWGSIPTDRRYTGQRQETFGLYDYGARYYSPGLGRWISADVLVPNPTNPQSLNRYAYVSNSPVVYLDPDGRFAIVPVLIVAGVVVLKAVDYGWTAYDVYQSGRTLADPNAGRGEKLLAGLNIALAVALEAGEPDDEVPVSLPLDDLGRRAVMAGARRALAEGGEEALERYLRERLGAQADEVLGWVMREVKKEGAEEVIEHHHLLPREFQKYFEAAGLDIDSPEFIIELPRDAHRLRPNGLHTGPENWNKLWKEFFQRNPTAEADEILQHLDWMMRRFGLR